MISGITGEMIESRIFAGPNYFQALRHHVIDKIQMRQCGSISAMTHVPLGGRFSGGSAMRFGEMERDGVLGHGAAKFLQERLTSDAYETIYCKVCGTLAIADALANKYSCRKCKGKATKDSFGRLTMPYSMKLLTHYLNGMGFNMKYRLATVEEYEQYGNTIPQEETVASEKETELIDEAENEAEDEIENADEEEPPMDVEIDAF
jgi:DNA-directed RNA polymerase II subunit RPB2